MEILLEYLGEIILGIELLLLKLFGKDKTLEEKKKAKLEKAKKKADKKIAQMKEAIHEVEDLQKEGE